MTKKDYIKFANMLEGQKPVKMDTETVGEYAARLGTWRQIVHKTADIFSNDNPRFDWTRFFKACGIN